MTGTREPGASERATSFLNCPRCGLSVRQKASRLTIEYSPRCIARARILVKLFSSPLPAGEVNRERFGPNDRSTTSDQPRRRDRRPTGSTQGGAYDG